MIKFERSIRSRQQGFTLIELMVTLAVVAIVAMIAGPNMASFVRHNRVSSSTNDMIAALGYARAEALRSGFPVTLCITGDSTATTPSCVVGSDWTGSDLVVVRDANRTGNPSASRLLQVFSTGGNSVTVTADDISFVRFLPNGSVENVVGGSEAVFSLKPDVCESNDQREVRVSRLGRARSAKVTCS